MMLAQLSIEGFSIHVERACRCRFVATDYLERATDMIALHITQTAAGARALLRRGVTGEPIGEITAGDCDT